MNKAPLTTENQTKAPGPLTGVMIKCVKFMRAEAGCIYRHPGGYWGSANFKLYESFGTSTVEGLVRRGVAEYTEWQEGRNGRFPIRATLKEKSV